MKFSRILKLPMIGIVLLAVVVLENVSLASGRFYPVFQAADAIQIDGKLAERSWQGAPQAGDFHSLYPDSAIQKTTFYVLHDDRNIYFGIIAYEASLDSQVLQRFEKEAVWTDDSIEFFLKTSPRKYIRFAVNAKGIRSDTRVEAAVTRHDDRYVVELRVPYTMLDSAPQSGQVFTGNVCRNTMTGVKPRLSSWALLDETFHEPNNFASFLILPGSSTAPAINAIQNFVNTDLSPRIIYGLRQASGKDSQDEIVTYLKYVDLLADRRRVPRFWKQAHDLSLPAIDCPSATRMPKGAPPPGVLAGEKRDPNAIVVDVGPQILQPSEQVVTPHIRWARPLAGGPLRVMFLDRAVNMREVVEFAQRLDIEYTFVPTRASGGSMFNTSYFRGGYYLGDEPGDKLRLLMDALAKPHDIIVIGNVTWTSIPDWARQDILNHVRTGTSLIRMGSGHVGYREDELLKSMRENSVTLNPDTLSGVPWQALPVFSHYDNSADLLEKTFDAFQFGKGLFLEIVGYKPADRQIISPGFVPDPLWHKWADLWWVSRKLYKKPRPDIELPITQIKPLDYDYNLALLIRVMLETAGRQPSVIVQTDGKWETFEREALSSLKFDLQVDQLKSDAVEMHFVLRDRDNAILQEVRQSRPLQEPVSSVSIPIKNIPAGAYFADMIIRQDGKVLGFGSRALKITSRTRITHLSSTRTSFRCDEPTEVKLSVDPGGRELEDLSLLVEQRDGHDRLVRRETFPITDRKFVLSLPPRSRPLTVWQHFQFQLLDASVACDRQKLSTTVSDLYLEDTIRIGAWEWPRMSYIQFHQYERMYDVGFDCTGVFQTISRAKNDYYGLGPHSIFITGRWEMATLANLRFMPSLARVADAGIGEWGKQTYLDHLKKEKLQIKDHIRYPCINEPKYLAAMGKRVDDVVDHYGPHATREYFFDQEPCYTQPFHRDYKDVCLCPLCQKYFHQFLRRTYGDISKVNLQYQTTYESIRQVPAITLEMAKADRSLGPMWVDYRLAMMESFDAFYKRFNDQIQGRIASARVGTAAPIYDGFRSGDAVDLWKFSRWMKLANPYPAANEQIRADFALDGALMNRGVWWGPARSRSQAFAKWHPWNDLFEGSNFWYSYYGDTGSTLANDLSMFKDFAPRMAQFNEIKSGIGQLIHDAKRGDSGVAVLYSPASAHQWTLTEAWGDINSGKKRYGRLASSAFGDNHTAWAKLLSDVIGPFTNVSYEQLENGVLDRGSFQLLILPYSQALSQKQAKAIQGFVASGGAVIADVRPGVSDDHGKPFDSSPLDSLFGVKQDTHKAVLRSAVVRSGVASHFDSHVDHSLQVGRGIAHATAGDIPILVRNRYEKGRALLLNFSVIDYVEVESGNAERLALKQIIEAELENMSVRPRIDIGNVPEGFRRYYFVSGDLGYIGLLPDLPEPIQYYAGGVAKPLKTFSTQLNLPTIQHCYDIRSGEYLDHTKQLEVKVKEGHARLLATLPYKVEKIDLAAPAQVVQGGSMTCQANIRATAPVQRHMLRISLRDATGNSIRHYTKVLPSESGLVKTTFELALNEKPGRYVLVAEDIATGVESRKTIEVTTQP